MSQQQVLRKQPSVLAQQQQHEEDMKKWEAFMTQYTKLSRALHRSSDTEMMLVNKCRDMKTELVDKASQLQVALATKQEDDVTIAKLRVESAKAWARADLATVREKAAQDLIGKLQQEIDNLRSQLKEAQADSAVEGGRPAAPMPPLKGNDISRASRADSRAEVSAPAAVGASGDAGSTVRSPGPQQPHDAPASLGPPMPSPFAEWKAAHSIWTPSSVASNEAPSRRMSRRPR
mmetsp:Transcript_4647/g.10035  ORF Transcript_4647/g.10035 Transcript_4647/m.10035 type:complete len:233 (-) Transcript_4647:48-746(-)